MPFRPDSPVELPNGRLVCGPHHLTVCGICTVDYSFMDEIGESGDEPMSDNETIEHPNTFSPRSFGTIRTPVSMERVIPTKFDPPRASDTPQTLFPPGISNRAAPPVLRFLHATNTRQFLIYTDGACLGNGQANPRAGCSFVFRPSTQQPEVHGYMRFRLESQGPTGEIHPQTSNRAELRAVIAALRFRFWPGEGCKSLVIATDSEYVVEGATSWVRGWLRRGWKTSTAAAVKNQDLWECLLHEIEQQNGRGLQVKFWRIPREWNTEADRHAKYAASEEAQDSFSDVFGVLV
ncbi:ribonuclease H-like domain-containing protein [Aspergillus granulosus]|uniref:ribonuclease H n=1 Tax=Aspergillus granulosus TaxID=176169 RepID=A0ABR4GTJ1_9EURO